MVKPGFEFDENEVGSLYADRHDRFVVSFISSWSPVDGIANARAAAYAAMGLLDGEGSSDTAWFVFDRATGVLTHFTQAELGR